MAHQIARKLEKMEKRNSKDVSINETDSLSDESDMHISERQDKQLKSLVDLPISSDKLNL